MAAEVPPGLGPRGRALWKSLAGAWRLDPDEVELATQACQLVDEIARLQVGLWQAGPLVAGSRNQQRPNPLLGELREHRKTLAAMLRGLRIPAREQQGSPSASSDAGRSLVAARWGKRG